MSALGHKRTYAVHKAMSALPPIATAKADMPQWSCPLYPQKQTCAAQYLMSAKGQKRTSSRSALSLGIASSIIESVGGPAGPSIVCNDDGTAAARQRHSAAGHARALRRERQRPVHARAGGRVRDARRAVLAAA